VEYLFQPSNTTANAPLTKGNCTLLTGGVYKGDGPFDKVSGYNYGTPNSSTNTYQQDRNTANKNLIGYLGGYCNPGKHHCQRGERPPLYWASGPALISTVPWTPPFALSRTRRSTSMRCSRGTGAPMPSGPLQGLTAWPSGPGSSECLIPPHISQLRHDFRAVLQSSTFTLGLFLNPGVFLVLGMLLILGMFLTLGVLLILGVPGAAGSWAFCGRTLRGAPTASTWWHGVARRARAGRPGSWSACCWTASPCLSPMPWGRRCRPRLGLLPHLHGDQQERALRTWTGTPHPAWNCTVLFCTALHCTVV